MTNDSVVEYKCPLGWVFQHSNNGKEIILSFIVKIFQL